MNNQTQFEKNLNSLGKTNRRMYEELREETINAGIQFYKSIKQVEEWEIEISAKQRKSLVFIFGPIMEEIPLNYKHAYLLKQIGDPKTVKKLNTRQFSFMQEIFSQIQVKGREKAIELYEAIHEFEENMNDLSMLQKQQQEAGKIFGQINTKYTQFCNSKHIMPEDLDALVEAKIYDSSDKPEYNGETKSDKKSVKKQKTKNV